MAQVKGEGKTDFVKGLLSKNPHANVKAVNEAWKAAGRDGAISESLVQRIRSEMNLTGNIRRQMPAKGSVSRSSSLPKSPRAAAARRAPASPSPRSNGAHAPAPVQSRSATRSEGRLLEELETDLDQLIYKVLGNGELGEIAEGLRRVRRLVVLRQES